MVRVDGPVGEELVWVEKFSVFCGLLVELLNGMGLFLRRGEAAVTSLAGNHRRGISMPEAELYFVFDVQGLCAC